jgi:hypothetical protein
VVVIGVLIFYLFLRELHYRRRAYSYDAVRGHQAKGGGAWAQEKD